MDVMDAVIVCKECHSAKCTEFPADVRVYLNKSRTVSAPPITPAPSILVCLQCGWSEFHVGQSWLNARWLRPIEIPPHLVASGAAAASGD